MTFAHGLSSLGPYRLSVTVTQVAPGLPFVLSSSLEVSQEADSDSLCPPQAPSEVFNLPKTDHTLILSHHQEISE